MNFHRFVNTQVCHRFVVAVLLAGLVSGAFAQGGRVVIPPPPSIVPVLPDLSPIDKNGTRVDDKIESDLAALIAARQRAFQPAQILATQTALQAPERVEVVLNVPVRAEHIAAFEAHQGEVKHIFKEVSYGWTGSLPRANAVALANALGSDLLGIAGDRPIYGAMYDATRNGRVRTVWQAGFAGVGGGLSGNTNVTIGVIDTGVDGTHTDLNGRMAFWYNATAEGSTTPLDLNGHGSHVAGIAVGSGAAHTAGSLRFTDVGTRSGFADGTFAPLPVFPQAGLTGTFSIIASWDGGGSTSLITARNPGTGWVGIASAAGASPQSVSSTITTLAGNQYSPALLQNSASTVGQFRQTVTIPHAIPSDGFGAMRGVAPGARWAGLKALNANRSGSVADVNEAIDEAVARRVANNLKVLNMSLGGAIDTTLRAKVTTASNSGILVVASAGNDGGAASVNDPGLAGLALTVGATNNANALTTYTSAGPAVNVEDLKPDLLAPGGSFTLGGMFAVDTNSQDNFVDGSGNVTTLPDLTANDYSLKQGTSMAAPFASGVAALVIQALESRGVTWDFASSAHARRVKMLMLATSTETNGVREASAGNNPTLGRAATPKDRFEGYGVLNADAAVEAVLLSLAGGGNFSDTLAGGAFGRRASARHFAATTGAQIALSLDVPASGDFDLYLYRATSDSFGNPVIAASSSQASVGTDESIVHVPVASEEMVVVVKLVSGSGAFTVTATSSPEIEVLDVAANIADGGGPIGFGSTSQGSAALTKIFTVKNTGSGNLTTSGLSVPSGYSVTEALSSTIAPSSQDTFTVALSTASAGTFPGTIQFTNNDSNENPFNFTVTGTIISSTLPEVEVLDGAANIADGSGPVSFGTVALGGTALSKTFTVKNTGTGNLTTSGLSIPSGYSLTEGLSATIGAGSQDGFTVSLPTGTAGTFAGTIQFSNNDSNENPFNFTVSGTVTSGQATLGEQYSLIASAVPTEGGSVSLNPLPRIGDQYLANTTVQLTAQPASGYTFRGWFGDATGSATTTSVAMTDHKHVFAAYRANGANDAYEPNNDYTRAQPVAIKSGNPQDNISTVSGLVLSAGDEDWYRLRLPALTHLRIDAIFSHSQGNIQMQLWDRRSVYQDRSWGQAVGESYTATNDEAITFANLTNPADLYLRVYVEGGTGNPAYVLSFTTTDIDDQYDVTTTNNSACETVPTLALNTTHEDLVLRDEDWYRLTLPNGTTQIDVDISHFFFSGDLNFMVIGDVPADCGGVYSRIITGGYGNDAGQNRERVTNINVSGRTSVLLRVYGANSFMRNLYDLRVDAR